MSDQPTAGCLPSPTSPGQRLATEELCPDERAAAVGHMIQLDGVRALAVLMVLLMFTKMLKKIRQRQ